MLKLVQKKRSLATSAVRYVSRASQAGSARSQPGAKPDSRPSGPTSSAGPPVDENGRYYGKFTKEEYENARQYVTTQYQKLEREIKGSRDVRENVGKMAQFPSSAPHRSVGNLSDLFQETIKTTGPMSLSAYMRQCLTHPEFGYYTTRNPLDVKSGDFVTSPEISSVFGEMVGIWLFSVWRAQGSPGKINVVEFGPGRGTLMHDAMRVFSKFVQKSGQSVESSIVLIEASPVLRKEQWKMLCGPDSTFAVDSAGFNTSTSKWGHRVTWLDTEKDVPTKEDECNYVLAHEFFDALPIKSFSKTEHGWRELLVEHTQAVVNTQKKLPAADDGKSATEVGPTPEELLTDFHLTTAVSETPSSSVPKLSPRYANLPVGSRVEICADAELYMGRIAQLVSCGPRGCGAALVIDYGPADEIPSNSLRGIYKHKFVSPFFRPGEVDLSIDVDFANLAQIAQPHAAAFGPVEQGHWLHAMGVGYRFDQLIKAANSVANKESLYQSYQRLTADEEMGKVYKFLAVLPKGAEKPVGFGGTA